MDGIRKKRQEQAEKYIEACLTKVSAGERLPSVRELIEGSGTARAPVSAVLKRYAEEGLVQVDFRRGIFKTAVKKKSKIIDFVACHDEGYSQLRDSFISDCIMTFCDIATKHEYSVRFHSFSVKSRLEDYVALTKLADSAGFVLIEPQIIEMVNTFRDAGFPVVCLFPNGRFTNVDQVKDAVSIVELQVRYLNSLGHKRILFLREEDPKYPNFTMSLRRLEYFKLMAKNGFSVPSHWRTECVPGELEHTLEWCFSEEPKPTAIISYDTDMPGVYDFLKKNGYVIGKDISVVATDGSAMLDRLIPKPTSYLASSSYSMELAWNLLEKQIKGDFKPVCYEIMLTLSQGDSTGPVSVSGKRPEMTRRKKC